MTEAELLQYVTQFVAVGGRLAAAAAAYILLKAARGGSITCPVT